MNQQAEKQRKSLHSWFWDTYAGFIFNLIPVQVLLWQYSFLCLFLEFTAHWCIDTRVSRQYLPAFETQWRKEKKICLSGRAHFYVGQEMKKISKVKRQKKYWKFWSGLKGFWPLAAWVRSMQKYFKDWKDCSSLSPRLPFLEFHQKKPDSASN